MLKNKVTYLLLFIPIFFVFSCHRHHHKSKASPQPTPSILLPSTIAVGVYVNNAAIVFPMLTTSTDRGTSWNYAIESGKNLPANFITNGNFNGASCSGALCIAGGTYNDGSVGVPMLAVSPNAGVTWNYTVESGKNLPASFHDLGNLAAVSCSGSLCVAGGNYNNGSKYVPMLAVSADAGVTWTYVVESGKNLPTSFDDFGFFDSVSCSESLCTAGGFYNNGSKTVPMLAVSANAGVTWNYAVESGKNLPASFDDLGIFNSVSCSGSLCIAGGNYNDGSTSYLMLAVSANAGVTWNYTIESGKNLPLNFTSGNINTVSCSGSFCTAGGSYNDGSTSYPMLAVSPNAGVTWNYAVESGKNLPKNFFADGDVFSVSCLESLCVVGGRYNDGSADIPMLAVSPDAGVTWNYTIESGTNLPANFNFNGINSNFSSVSCASTLCTAGGQYNDGVTDIPMLAVSTDTGVTWNYAIESGKNLPTSFAFTGSFTQVSSSNNP